MKTCLVQLHRLLAFFAVFLACTGLAHANPIGNSSVDFENGKGTLTGFFQTDASAQVTSWDLTSSMFDCNPCGLSSGFPGIHYTQGSSTAQVGFSFGYQSITFHDNASPWQVSFVLDCGGNSADCLGTATLGSTIALKSAFEMNGIDFLPYRALTLASLDVTDPPVGFSFNLVPAATDVPEPHMLMLLVPAFAALLGLRRKNAPRYA